MPIDRFYINKFLELHRSDITGRIIEIGDDIFSSRYGSDILKISVLRGKGRHRRAQSHDCDLTEPETVMRVEKADCVICTNTLNFIYDQELAVKTISNMLVKKGVALFTVAGASAVSTYDHERWGDYWRFTDQSLKRVLEKHFKRVDLCTFGNSKTSVAAMLGLCIEDIPGCLLKVQDTGYQVIIAARAAEPRCISDVRD
jgi:hypothetical protein